MLQKLKKQESGFTIIEVLIVLAIAGLILLIVFLAVPALQRNSRNTQIKNDASAVAGGVSEFLSNNNGQAPTGASVDPDGTVEITGGSGTASATAKVRGGTGVTIGASASTTLNDIVVVLSSTCDNNAPTGGSSRSVAVTFNIEDGSGNETPQCTEG